MYWSQSLYFCNRNYVNYSLSNSEANSGVGTDFFFFPEQISGMRCLWVPMSSSRNSCRILKQSRGQRGKNGNYFICSVKKHSGVGLYCILPNVRVFCLFDRFLNVLCRNNFAKCDRIMSELFMWRLQDERAIDANWLIEILLVLPLLI